MRSLFLLALLTGCEGVIRTVAPPGFDLSTTASDGGSNTNVKFNPDIQNDINMLGCALAPCHASTNDPVLVPNPTAAQDIMANYTAFSLKASEGASSPVLLVNVPPSTHTGGPKLTNTDSEVYKRWLGWIENGRPQ